MGIRQSGPLDKLILRNFMHKIVALRYMYMYNYDIEGPI